ncbi:MAG: recombinase family protein [Armatimonadota bacterium]
MAKANQPSKPVSAAIYLRVSDEEQVKEGYSLTTQETLCRDRLDRQFGPDLYVATVYADEGLSHKYGLYDPDNPRKKFRPGLTRLVEAFKEGKHQVLCIWELDRLYRKAGFTEFLDEHFVPYGLEELISIREDINFKTASGRFHINIMAAGAAFEIARLGERVSDASHQRRREGYLHKIPYGWRRQTDEEMAGQRRRGVMPDEEQSEIVKWMADEYLAGNSIQTITQQLNDRGIPTPRRAKRWSRATVRYILGNPAYAGLVELDGELSEGQHYPHRFYDPDVFHQMRARLESNARVPRKLVSMPQYLLAGILHCGHCGARVSCTSRGNHREYRCPTGGDAGSDVDCPRVRRPADVIEAAIISQLRQCAQDPKVQERAAGLLRRMVDDEERRLREDVARLAKELEKRVDEYRFWSRERYEERITLEEFELHREHLLAEKAELEERLEASTSELKSSEQRAAELQQALETLRDFDATFDGLTLDQQREMVQLLVKEARMFYQSDGSIRLVFTVRAFGEFERIIPRLTGGDLKMTPRQMEAYMLWAQGLDRKAIGRKMGLSGQVVSQYLSTAKSRVGADSREEAYEMVRDEIEANADLLVQGRRRRKRTDPNKPPLTDAQKQVLSLYAEGLTGLKIAEQLGTGPSTPYVHLKNCRDRLGCTSNEDAVRHAKKMGYID